MSACLRCGQLVVSSGLFCNQCHSSLVHRFQDRWYRDEYNTISSCRVNTHVHTICSPRLVRHFPFPLILRCLFVIVTLMIIAVFVAATILLSFVFSQYDFISPLTSSLPQIGGAPLHIRNSAIVKHNADENSSKVLSMLGVSPSSVLFSVVHRQPDPPDQAVAIANIGAGDISWSAQTGGTNISWLHMDISEGSLTGDQVTQIALHIYAVGLIVGRYHASVFVSAADITEATNSADTWTAGNPQTFTVQLDVLDTIPNVATP